MEFKELKINTLSEIFEFLNKEDLEHFALAGKKQRLLVREFMINSSGIKALSNSKVNFEVLSKEIGKDEILRLSEYVGKNPEIAEILYKIIKSSAKFGNLALVAGNAATLLCCSGYDFSFKDLTKVNLLNANLESGRFFGTNFAKASMKNVNFNRSCTIETSFSSANLINSTPKTYPKNYQSSHIIQKSFPYSIPDLHFFHEEVSLILSTDASCIAIFQEGFFLSYSILNKIHLWLSADNRYIFEAHTDPISALAFFPSGEFLVSGDSANLIKIWKIKNSYCLFSTLIGHTSSITCLCVSPNSQLIASGSFDRNVKVWDKKRRKLILSGHDAKVSAVGWNCSSELIVSAGHDGMVKIWNLQGFCVNFINNQEKITVLCIDLRDKIWTGDKNGSVKTYGFCGKLEKIYNSGLGKLKSLQIDPKSEFMLIHGSNGIMVEGTSKHSLKESHGHITSIAFDDSEDLVFLGYSSGFLIKYSLKSLVSINLIKLPRKIMALGLLSGTVLVSATKFEIFIHDKDLILINTVSTEKIFHCKIEDDRIIAVMCGEEQVPLKIINPITTDCLFSTSIYKDFIEFHLHSYMLIVEYLNSLFFFNLSSGKRWFIEFPGKRRAFLLVPYLLVDNKNYTYVKRLDTGQTGFYIKLYDKVLDVKTTKIDNCIVICTCKNLLLCDNELNVLGKIGIEQGGMIFIIEAYVFVWTKNFLMKLKIEQQEAEKFIKETAFCLPE